MKSPLFKIKAKKLPSLPELATRQNPPFHIFIPSLLILMPHSSADTSVLTSSCFLKLLLICV